MFVYEGFALACAKLDAIVGYCGWMLEHC